MRKIHEILRLHWDCKLSQRQIANSCAVSRAVVNDYIHRAHAAGLSWPLREGLDESGLEKLLFPHPVGRPKTEFVPPDFAEMHQKLKQKGMTLALLWERYKMENPEGPQYSHFCAMYRTWAKTIDVVMRQTHEAGKKLFSDFAGSTLPVTDPVTGEVVQAHIFVAALGASSFTYAEAFWSENCESWCTGHANAFMYMNGVSEICVPDNPKAAVDKPSQYDPDIHADFQHMASFFGVAVIPARVRHPKDKATVECAVKVATMWIVAALRDTKFFSLAELNQHIKQLLEKLNNRPFKKVPGSRRSLFESIDKPALQPLPGDRYEYTHIGYARVGLNYHIDLDGYLYSVPYEHAKKEVEYRLTAKTVEVFLKGRRIASHLRLWIKNRPSTLKEHMPSHHRYYQEEYIESTPEKLITTAANVGVATAQAVQSILLSKQHSEQSLRACLGVLRLARTWGDERLEAACQKAVDVNGCSYKSIKLILENSGDRRPNPTTHLTAVSEHENLRGSEYYNPSTKEDDIDANTPDDREPTITEASRNETRPRVANANA